MTGTFRGIKIVADGTGTEQVEVQRRGRAVEVIRTRFDLHRTPVGAPDKSAEKLDTTKAASRRFDELVAQARAGGCMPVFKKPTKRAPSCAGVSDAPVAPVLWSAQTPKSAFAIFVDASTCWVGNNEGMIHVVDHEGAHLRSYAVPKGVGCILRDDAWTYAGCDDGRVYDLSRDEAHVAYEVNISAELLAMSVHDGDLVVADWGGCVACFDHESGQRWSTESGSGDGWALVCDDSTIVHGHEHGLTALDWSGKERWRKPTEAPVTCGARSEDVLAFGNDGSCVWRYAPDGRRRVRLECDAPVTACCLTEDGETTYVGDHEGAYYAFDFEGKRLWKLASESAAGAALALGCYGERLFAATRTGALFCVDVNAKAVAKARRGDRPEVRRVALPKRRAARTVVREVATTTDASAGVVVECVRDDGRLRVRVVSDGYEKAWNCQFPSALRVEGERFVVDAVVASRRGGFYRVQGAIRRLASPASPPRRKPTAKSASKPAPTKPARRRG